MSLNPLQSLQSTAVCFGQITTTPGSAPAVDWSLEGVVAD